MVLLLVWPAVFSVACSADDAKPAQPGVAPTLTPAPAVPQPTITPPPALTVAPAKSPTAAKAVPSANVSRLQAWKDAELIASLGEGRLEVIGSGDSMRPMYGENTILVISRIKFEELQPGMTIAYTNEREHRVVHQLLAKDRLGWRVQGLNNEVEDRERVTRDNLIGVVYASLAYDPALK